MCGIVGVAGKLLAKHEGIFADLLTICQLRGRHATGVVAVKTNNDVEFVKETGTPERILDSKEYDRKITAGLNKVLIGHCRHATIGRHVRDNAHPFNYENVIGVHNGTLRDWRTKPIHPTTDIEVDSDWLYATINEFGVEETIRELHEQGAWALSYWNKTTHSLNFIRNKERPLFFAWNEAKDVMWWASEAWMLWAVERKDTCAVLTEETNQWTVPLPVNTLWSFDVNITAQKEKVFTYRQMIEVEAERKTTSNFTKGSHTATGFHNNGYHWGNRAIPTLPTPSNKGGSSVESPFLLDNELDDDIPLLGPPQDPQEGKTTSSSSATQSNGNSSTTTGLAPATNKQKRSSKPKLSLVSKTSEPEPTTNRKKSSNESEGCTANTRPIRKDTTFRTVAGIPFISSISRGVELSEEEFIKNTDCRCFWCKEKIEELEEVHTLLQGGKAFVCIRCEQ